MSGPTEGAGAWLELPDGRRLVLDKDTLTLGRSSGNDVPLPDGQISRRHARLQRLPQGWLLLDLKSANGTWVNGYQVVGPHLLQDGDQITLGEQRMVFHVDRGAPPPVPRRRQQAETVLGRSAFGRDTPAPAPAPDDTPTGEHRIGG
jgi:pSer/pThr/pTyr-binding forkhead associated (FHA) protein